MSEIFLVAVGLQQESHGDGVSCVTSNRGVPKVKPETVDKNSETGNIYFGKETRFDQLLPSEDLVTNAVEASELGPTSTQWENFLVDYVAELDHNPYAHQIAKKLASKKTIIISYQQHYLAAATIFARWLDEIMV